MLDGAFVRGRTSCDTKIIICQVIDKKAPLWQQRGSWSSVGNLASFIIVFEHVKNVSKDSAFKWNNFLS